MTTSIREFRQGDLEPIARLSGQLGYPASVTAMVERVQELAASPADAVFVAVDEAEQIVGWIHIARRVLLESGPFAEILGLVVDEAFRNCRIGEALVHHAEAWAHDRGLSEIRVRSNVIRERARGFYERLGYHVVKQQAVFRKSAPS